MVAFFGPRHENEAHPRKTAEDYMVQPPWIPFLSTLSYRRHEAEWMATVLRPNASGISDDERFWQLHHPCCRLIIFRSSPEAEPQLFPLMADLFHKPVLPAGLLLPDDAVVYNQNESFSGAMQWLDQQPRRSVIYVALGSEAPVMADHVHELARGLELAGVRFLWALRPPSMMLPEGFVQRVAGRGVVHQGWLPQVRVLAHDAVGAFLTHCGWGSTLESFRFGLPLVMLPFILDQGLTARAMAARGIGVEVARNDVDGSFRGEDVAAAVRRVMVEDEGDMFARNAMELQKSVGDKLRQEQYIDQLGEYLQGYK